MKDVLTKLFPRHTTGDAGFIIALLATALLVGCLALNDGVVRGYSWHEVRATVLASLVFVAGATLTYLFGKRKR
jgi:membrane protease YdiL (CAAX protease family)